MVAREEFPAKNRQVHRVGVYATVVVVVFLLGFVPMWLTARSRASERDALQEALRLAQIENSLAAATIQARRGEYEPAREAASTFYSGLQAELGRPEPGVLAPAREALQPLLAERDEMITLLARADESAAERLGNAYVVYRQATANLPGQEPAFD